MDKRPKIIEEARKRYQRAREHWGPIYERARDDCRFSDQTDPDQWPESVKRERQFAEGGARPCLVFDQTGQFVRQVINTARRNKPAMKFLPVDDKSDPKLAEILQGLARQVEHDSRAEVAYITGLDHATRGGIGYFRLVTEESDADTEGQLCAKIKRVVDFETIWPDPEFQEPDGSDMGWCFVEESLSRDEFKKRYPKAAEVDWDSDGWFGKDHVRIAEYFRTVETVKNTLVAQGREWTEDEYWSAWQAGEVTEPASAQPAKKRVVEWIKLSGEEVLEQTTFPATFVPVFPVIGNESWEKGERKLGGCVRPARDAQISYNFERNSEFEAVALGPKAPFIASVEAIDGHESKWRMANRGNLAYLPYNSVDEEGNPIQAPQRVNPAGVAAGWTTLSERSRQDIQSALGMFSAAVGDNPNSQSGRAVLALQDRADVGSFHYVDNLALSISHCGRVLTQVWPAIYDTAQVVRILGEDDEPDFVRVDPQMPMGYAKTQQGGREVTVINPGVGKYDVRCTVGPAYTSRQAEAAAEIGEIVNGNPQMMAILGDVWVKMRNFPEADRIAKRFAAMLPPEVKAAEQEEEGEQEIPPHVKAVLQNAAQEIQQLQQALQEAQSGIQQEQAKAQTILQKAQIDAQSRERVAEINADTKRDVEELKGLVAMLIQQMQPPPQLAQEVAQDFNE